MSFFTKPKQVGGGTVHVRRYKRVIDWEAVLGAAFVLFIALGLLSAIT